MATQFSFRLGLACLSLFVCALVSGYFFGRTQGADLDRARAHGEAVGSRLGKAEGLRKGYQAGYHGTYAKVREQEYMREKKRVLEAGSEKSRPVKPTVRACGDLVEAGAGSYSVQATNVVCDIADQVARQWEMNCTSSTCTVAAGFSCSSTSEGSELARVTCIDGDRKVTFENGS